MALPRVIVEELEERARSLGVSVEEYLMDLLLRGIDPVVGAEKYLRAAEELLEQARRELERGGLRQASEEIWGACALAIKAHALHREGRRLESHRELWVYKNRVARELGEWVRHAFMVADSMHKNEGMATREDVEDALREVERLVESVRKALGERG